MSEAATDHPDRVDPSWVGTRWLRAGVTAGVALSLGTVAHTAAGGLLPPTPVLVVLALVGTVSCWALLARPASTARLVVLVVAVQTVGHGVLTALAGHAGAASPGSGGLVPAPTAARPVWEAGSDGARRTGSLRDLTSLDVAGAGSGPDLSQWWTHWWSALTQELTGPHAAMALAHLVAAGLLGLWLAVGERALATLVHLGGRRARAAVAHTLAVLEGRRRSRVGAWSGLPASSSARPGHGAWTTYDARPRLLAEVCRAVSRRGPPIATAS